MKEMPRLNLNISKIKDYNLLRLAETVLYYIKKHHEVFGDLHESIDKVKFASDEYQTAYYNKCRFGRKDDTKHKNETKKELIIVLKSLGLLVESKAKGDLLTLHQSGFDIYKKPKDKVILKAVTNMEFIVMEEIGSLKLKIKPVKFAKSYDFQYTEYPVTQDSIWQTQVEHKASTILKNLIPGQRYAFRVISKGKNPIYITSREFIRYMT